MQTVPVTWLGLPVTWLGLPALDVGNPFGETDGWTCLVVDQDTYLIRVSEEEINT